ncbi:MAG: V-type ATP synthase subunit I [Oscillospiraceae bacterium]|nr:V-type ATP synthase subunit I [Oscillospiraceae bacterium]
MAICEMVKLNIYALKKDRKDVLETVQFLNVLHIEEFDDFKELEKEKKDFPVSFFKRTISDLESAVLIVEKFCKEKKSELSIASKPRMISFEDYKSFSKKQEFILKKAREILVTNKLLKEEKDKILNTKLQIEALCPLASLNIPLSLKKTRYTRIFIGSFPQTFKEDEFFELIKKKISEKTPVHFQILSANKECTLVFLICLIKDESVVLNNLVSCGFSKISFYEDVLSVKKIAEFKENIENSNTKIEFYIKKIRDFSNYFEDFLMMIDFLAIRSQKYDVIGKIFQTKEVFILSGYTTKNDFLKLKRALSSKFDIFIQNKCVERDDTSAPTVLKNLEFASFVEPIVESYGLPNRKEVDPTFIMSFFYYLFFGIMLSDAVYGFLIFLGCFIALKKIKNAKPELKKNLKMFCVCGLSTIFWGILFGSYFGDFVSVLSKNFFNKEVHIEPLWLDPIKYPMKILTLSLMLGIIHMFTGLGIKLYSFLKQGKIVDAICDVLSWYFLIGGLILFGLSTQLVCGILAIKPCVSKEVADIAKFVALLGATIILFFSGRGSKNFIVRLCKGLYELYSTTSYLSDILSYSRLLALGLATGVISSVFNLLASMTSSVPYVGFLLFIVIFLMSHVLNIGINLLGAYVHTNRLQFVEFFGKFYEGGGKAFKVFKPNSKYHIVS